VLGAGLIGVDLLVKARSSTLVRCDLVVGRDSEAIGLRQAAALGCATASDGIHSIVAMEEPFDIVFDSTNAASHADHWGYLQRLNTMLIDLTPSMVGQPVVPTVNGAEALTERNVSLVSCGGQASIPILHALAQRYQIDYIEVVTTAASRSVGRATRLNLDEYIETTQDAVGTFTGVGNVKVMANLSPARPPVPFRVTTSVLGSGLAPDPVRRIVAAAAEHVRAFAPGFTIAACTVADGKAFVAIEVTASRDRIPVYAGNLDIINSAALLIAERYAEHRASAVTTVS
jgi:acetaldehyde dehydrogenase